MTTLAPDPIGVEPDYEQRFASHQWDTVGGNIQSIMFAVKALEILKQKYRSLADFIAGGFPLIDYGCALGDGTAILSATFQGVPVIGCDISPVAVQRATERWPTLTFDVDDIRAPHHVAHCIWTSHTLEHQEDPAAIVAELRKRCRLLVAIFPPIVEDDKSDAHKGAVPTQEWLSDLERPLAFEEFMIRRRDSDNQEKLWEERSMMCVWRGLAL